MTDSFFLLVSFVYKTRLKSKHHFWDRWTLSVFHIFISLQKFWFKNFSWDDGMKFHIANNNIKKKRFRYGFDRHTMWRHHKNKKYIHNSWVVTIRHFCCHWFVWRYKHKLCISGRLVKVRRVGAQIFSKYYLIAFNEFCWCYDFFLFEGLLVNNIRSIWVYLFGLFTKDGKL